MRRCLLLAAVAAVALAAGTAAQPARHNVILVTLDGARTEEIFGGLDVEVLRSTLDEQRKVEDSAIYKELWADSAVRRREKLMPFFWGTLIRDHGSIAGNHALGSRVRLTNRHWFSYPGYSEMLLGRAHDDIIKSNDAVQNPFPTVLEFLRIRLRLPPEGVAAFASWSVFNAIAESKRGTLTVNAGFEPYEHPDAQVKALSALQFSTPTPWDTVRHDVYTARLAMAHMATYKPQVLYLALGETDDWAHDGRYDRVLEAYMRTDRILRDLWEWLQNQPEYRGRTSILITTDHGRGHGAAGWRHHGEKYPGSEDTWMAFISPSLKARGEWRTHPPLETRQVAATLLAWAGLDWTEFDAQAGVPVRQPTN
jgi:Type I phosphodiesterase / nucleotide pyrophosphatase